TSKTATTAARIFSRLDSVEEVQRGRSGSAVGITPPGGPGAVSAGVGSGSGAGTVAAAVVATGSPAQEWPAASTSVEAASAAVEEAWRVRLLWAWQVQEAWQRYDNAAPARCSTSICRSAKCPLAVACPDHHLQLFGMVSVSMIRRNH
ncbi:GD17942, partial [Drosophila simulans]